MNFTHELYARYDCKNLVGSHLCVCPEGFRKVGYSDDCEDVDECGEDAARCGEGGRCINTQGGFRCECRRAAGFEPSPDGRRCLDRRLGRCHREVLPSSFGLERCPASSERERSGAEVTKSDCCCALGAAWGERCELCPAKGE